MAEPEDFKPIREIVASGGHKYTSGNIDRSRYQRLVDLGWLNAFVTNMSDVAYRVTERGKAAASR
jgi:predicted ABC-type ATPase